MNLSNNITTDYAAKFDISQTEFERIASAAINDKHFVEIWENANWWTDENNDDERQTEADQ